MDLAQQVAELLQPPPADATSGLGVEVRLDAGGGKGKGVFATKSFRVDDVVFQETPLVAIQHIENKEEALACANCFCLVGGIAAQLEHRLQHAGAGDNSHAGASSSRTAELPLCENFILPDATKCRGGCTKVVYCSDTCRDQAWHRHHSLLCVRNGPTNGRDDPWFLAFCQHADETNDVFYLAAQVICTTLQGAWDKVAVNGGSLTNASNVPSPDACWEALKEAWMPFSMGHKGLWWDTVAKPSDVPDDEEAEFRTSLRELASDSLSLLTDALQNRAPALVTAFPSVLDVTVWGSIIGMFEMNNLELFVVGQVPLWAHRVSETTLSSEDTALLNSSAALAAVGGLQGILEDEEAWAVKGNAFYSLQACMNHSCIPNAHAFKRDDDRNGNAVILAQCDIQQGDEITISYVDEDAPLEERTEYLSDYGFLCSCDKCSAEKLAAELGDL